MRFEDHLDNLVRHVEQVRENCTLLGKRLIAKGRRDIGLALIARGFEHDSSKFYGIEWEYLHNGADVPSSALRFAIEHHTKTNDHHPEYWGGIRGMPEVAVAEMVCDWYARAQEFGTGLRDWITENAIQKYGLAEDDDQYKWINNFVDMLLVDYFQRT